MYNDMYIKQVVQRNFKRVTKFRVLIKQGGGGEGALIKSSSLAKMSCRRGADSPGTR